MSRPEMTPAPGSRLVRYVGDRIRFALRGGARAFLRTNLTRGGLARQETIALSGAAASAHRTFAGASWRDIPLRKSGDGWELDLALTEVGYFRAKAYCVDEAGNQLWPEGEDVGVAVHPDRLRTGNTLYCAFPRMFGPARTTRSTREPLLDEQLNALDQRGFTVIPPSGKLRELTAAVPHILETLGCRILHLLPLGPTPTTFARFGRFGSPYAQMDLTAIDPALVEFDERTTGVEQFQELTHAVHLRRGLVLLDIVINHTGWGSRLMEGRPDWFHRNPDGTFHSPGAWGVTWGDLVELDNRQPRLWEVVADSLLTWCRRGVDGFRCDAGYMVPLQTWQYVIARVRQEFPDCTFLLEGLGGPWETTETLLTEGGMQWAYSELFQNFGPREISGYLDHALGQGTRIGPLVHYSETHDNDRLARRGADWSLHRNRLCALTSLSGAFGFTAGVEWLATEKIEVHQARGMAWGSPENLVEELGRLNRLICDHPCFFDGAEVTRLSPEGSPVLALRRVSWDRGSTCLVLVNLTTEPQEWGVGGADWKALGRPLADLLGQASPRVRNNPGGSVTFVLRPWAAYCLAPDAAGPRLAGPAYRAFRAQAAWALQALATALPVEDLGPMPWQDLAALAASDPAGFLAGLPYVDPATAATDLAAALAAAKDGYPRVVAWSLSDLGRVVPVPPGHWLLVEDEAPFEASLSVPGRTPLHLRSIPGGRGHVAAVDPGWFQAGPGPEGERDAEIRMERFKESRTPAPGRLRLLPAIPAGRPGPPAGSCLLTNGRGGMARLQADLGGIASKYDCLLGANLHPEVPCDRHVLAKRMRAWVVADGFLTALDRHNLVAFEPGPPATWRFAAAAGDARAALIELKVAMLPGRNTVAARFSRVQGAPGGGDLPAQARVVLTVRPDLEDRGFHEETTAGEGADRHFRDHLRALADRPGFRFQPAPDRGLAAWSGTGTWHAQAEWCLGIPHPVEASRGMKGSGDAWSPGWFELPLTLEAGATLVFSADPEGPDAGEVAAAFLEGPEAGPPAPLRDDPFGLRLWRASRAFLAKRGPGMTVVAGYPWFLDWGRDTFIAARGLVRGGMAAEVREILATFAALEDRGTLPNMLSADSTADRDTSDAPLWFALAVEEAGAPALEPVLASIAAGYRDGTPNGIRVDPDSGLVWSPSHFTWMDTNHPAGTPRQGYPVEIQALWIRLLRRLGPDWADLADRAEASLDLFWDPDQGWFHDHLEAGPGVPAAQALPDGHLRPNQLFLVSLGLVKGARARGAVEACARHLLVPGALRSLANLPVPTPLPIRGPSGLLNDPMHPYWGRYEGDEDTRRKPAYHNGTAWVWLLPTFCEALALAWDRQPEAVEAARAILGSLDGLLATGCQGQLPEILDGDAPHAPRGCDAQAWSATEALRVWMDLKAPEGGGPSPGSAAPSRRPRAR